jgi:hypothetical protein
MHGIHGAGSPLSSASEAPKALRDRPAPLWLLWPVAALYAFAGARNGSARKSQAIFIIDTALVKGYPSNFLAARLQFAMAPC